jgi:excisionase family DNA binding protein
MAKKKIIQLPHDLLAQGNKDHLKLKPYNEIIKTKAWNRLLDDKNKKEVVEIIDLIKEQQVEADFSTAFGLVLIKCRNSGVSAIELQKEITTLLQIYLDKLEYIDDKLILLMTSSANLKKATLLNAGSVNESLPLIKYLDTEIEYWQSIKSLNLQSIDNSGSPAGIVWKPTPAMLDGMIDQKLRERSPDKPQPPDSNEIYLTRKEVCERLKISLATLHAKTKLGILTGYKIGRKVLYKPDEVDAALRKTR